jgi:hypothetical protein
MVTTIPEIIAAINPKLYMDLPKDKMDAKKELEKFDKLVKEKGINVVIKEYELKNKRISSKPLSSHQIVYDSSSETLEPIYFFTLDLMREFGMDVEKLVDNFSSSTGSGHFGELGQRLTVMQQQGTKLLGDINTVLRSILNIIYDLKEFKIRLEHYDILKNSDPKKREAAVLSLKQVWMDKVDIQKGNSALKAMASTQIGFVTIIDAFLASTSLKDVNNLDLNDRVKRVVLSRQAEFELWLNESEKELRKRYNLERTYLKSQVNSLKLYTRWAKPYLKAAQQLEQMDVGRKADVVKTFNTIYLQLTLLGKQKLRIEDEALKGTLPLNFKKMKTKRDYFMCYLIDFNFRGIPQRISGQQGNYVFGGRAEVTFSSYALNSDELKALNIALDESDLADGLSLIENITTESLGELEEDIKYFLGEEEDSSSYEEGKKSSKGDGSNPFLALIGFYNEEEQKPKSKNKGKEKLIIEKDNWIESEHLRKLASESAQGTLFALFDVYKKAHGMYSYA